MTRDFRKWAIITFLLLVIAASRFVRLHDLVLNPDEIWSVWQTLGTPTQIIQWTPYDWPPLYYLVLGAWRSFTSPYPLTLRIFSTLIFLIGTCGLYRVARRLRGESAAILAVLGYASLGYATLLSLEVRGYALLLGIMPLALWLAIRYFDKPKWWRAIPLATALAAMFYTSVTSVGAILMIGLYTMIVYRQGVWRWWLPGILAAVMAAPEIIAKSSIAVSRVQATQTLTPPPLLPALADLFWRYIGNTYWLWVILFITATILIVSQRRLLKSPAIAFGVWAIVIPVVIYILNPILGFFSARYSWWVMIGISLWVAWGLSYLPRRVVIGVSILLAGMVFYPIPTTSEYDIWPSRSPLGSNFAWLRDHIQSGDVVLADQDNGCGGSEEWDYYLRTYFPNGLQFVDTPGEYQRVWYVIFDGHENEAVTRTLNRTHIPGIFVGPAQCLFRLYEAPPDIDGLLFENGMRFHGFDVMLNGRPWSGPLVRHEGETVRLRLWWSADRAIDRDYSVGIYAIREGGERPTVQSDSPPQVIYPQGAPVETSRWSPDSYYVEERELQMPYPTPNNEYNLYLAVYYWEDSTRVAAPGVTSEALLFLRQLHLKAY